MKLLKHVTVKVPKGTICIIEAGLRKDDAPGQLADPSVRICLDKVGYTPPPATPQKLTLVEKWFKATYLAQTVGGITTLSNYAGQ